MRFYQLIVTAISGTITTSSAFTAAIRQQLQRQQSLFLHAEKPIGIFFGTSTGSTEEAAHLIATEFGGDIAAGPFEIDEVQGSVADEFAKYDSLIVGTPTWNTGADMERSGTGWDEIYYSEMQELNIAGKKVAVFGLGDSVSYSENYADATGELHDVFQSLGCKLIGYTSTEGYLHDDSKAIRGEKFCGLLLDAVNQEELTKERVKKWVADIISEGILDGSSTVSSAATVPSSTTTPFTTSADQEDESSSVEQLLKEIDESPFGYVAHYNPRTDKTMWISADGRSSYKTKGSP